MKIVKQYGENINLKNVIIEVVEEENAIESLAYCVEKELDIRYYELNIDSDVELDDDQFENLWEKEFQRKREATIQFAKDNGYCKFGDYAIVIMNDEEDYQNKWSGMVGGHTWEEV